jgi:hypothetical protein
MWRPRVRGGLAIALLLIAAGCAPHKPFELSKEDRDRFGGSVLRVSVPSHDPMIFGLDDCVLYKAKTAHDDIVGWTVVLASDWGQESYPKWATVCTSQRVRYDRKYVIASFCAQAIGAGGGCAGGDGTYRKAGKCSLPKGGIAYRRTKNRRSGFSLPRLPSPS